MSCQPDTDAIQSPSHYLVRRSSAFLCVLAAQTATIPFVLPSHLPMGPKWAYALSAFNLLFLLLATMGVLTPGSWLSAIRHPPVLAMAWFLVLVVVPGYAGFHDPTYVASLGELGVLDFLWVPAGLLMVTSGFTVMVLIYTASLDRVPVSRSLTRAQSWAPQTSLLALLYLCTVLVRIGRIALTGVPFGADTSGLGLIAPLDQWFGYLESSRFIVLAFLVAKSTRDRRLWPFLTVAIATEGAFALTSGFIKPVVVLVVVLTLSQLLDAQAVHRRPTHRIALSALAIVSVTVFTTPIAQQSRFLQGAGMYNTRNPMEIMDLVSDAYGVSWGDSLRTGFDIFSAKALGRQAQAAHMPGIVLKRVPSEIPYSGMHEFALIPAHLVPRILWAEKPTLSTGVALSVRLLNFPASTRSSSTATAFGEAYMFGGLAGVLIAALALGLALALLARNTILTSTSSALYVAMVPTFIDWEQQFSTMFITIVQQGIVLSIILYGLVRLSGRHATRLSPAPSRLLEASP